MKTEIKNFLSKKIDIDNLRYLKGFYLYAKKIPFFILKKKFKEYNQSHVEKIFSEKKFNIFFRYYDLNPLNEEKLLVHKVRKNAKTSKEEAEIDYYDINNKSYHKISYSKAWCCQQESRLRRSKKYKNCIFYNDLQDNNYCSILFDIETRKNKKIIEIFSNPRLRNETRCDLHPRLCNCNQICIDTTFKNCLRSVCIVKVGDYNEK